MQPTIFFLLYWKRRAPDLIFVGVTIDKMLQLLTVSVTIDKMLQLLTVSVTIDKMLQVSPLEFATCGLDLGKRRLIATMDDRPCKICAGDDSEGLMLLCEICNLPYHATCVGFEGPLESDWFCLQCQPEIARKKRRVHKPVPNQTPSDKEN